MRGGSTNDLVKAARKNAGLDLSQLYDDWIYTTGWVSRIRNNERIADLEAYYRSRALR